MQDLIILLFIKYSRIFYLQTVTKPVPSTKFKDITDTYDIVHLHERHSI